MKLLLILLLSVIIAIEANKINNIEYVATPQGYVPKDCVHHVPNGASISHLIDGRLKVTHNNKFLKILPLCPHSPVLIPRHNVIQNNHNKYSTLDYDGWEGYTAYKYNQSFDTFLGDFSVPAAPEMDPEVLYLFTGLQNIDWIPKVDPDPSQPFDIIQPVLQYPGDFGNYWSVKSWYVTLDVGTVASDEVPNIQPGDAIFGNMTRTGVDSWYIGSTVVSNKKTTSIVVKHPRLKSQPWAYNTLECYGCSGCQTYPSNSPCKFTKLSLTSNGRTVTPNWLVNPKPSHDMQCHEKPVVESPDQVTIYFDKQN